MAINYTPTTPVPCTIKTTGRDIKTTDGHSRAPRGEPVILLAFGWADAQPETCTGVWVLRQEIGGVTFYPTKAIESLKPRTLQDEVDFKRTNEAALRALDLVSDLRVNVARMRVEVGLPEDFAFESEELAGSTSSRAAPSTGRRSSSSKTTSRTSTRRGSGAKPGR